MQAFGRRELAASEAPQPDLENHRGGTHAQAALGGGTVSHVVLATRSSTGYVAARVDCYQHTFQPSSDPSLVQVVVPFYRRWRCQLVLGYLLG